MLDEEGYFFISQKEINITTKLHRSKQSNIIRHLKQLNILKVKKIGLPARNWYYLDVVKLSQLSSGTTTSLSPETHHSSNNNNNNNNNNKNISSKEEICFSEKNVKEHKRKRPKPTTLKRTEPKPPTLTKRESIRLDNKLKLQIKYWNRNAPKGRGKNISSHRLNENIPILGQSKILNYANQQLNIKYKEGFEPDMINEMFSIYFSFISKRNYNKTPVGTCVSIGEFLRFTKDTKDKISENKNNPLIGFNSWFDIIRNSPCDSEEETVDYLLKTFGGKIIDEFPKTTKMVKKLFLNATQKKKLSVKEENNLIKASKNLNEFYKAHRKKIRLYPHLREDENILAKILFEDKWDTDEKQKTLQSHFLLTQNLWDTELKNILRKQGRYE